MIYALSSASADWYTSIVMAGEDMVSALYETLVQRKRAPLPLNEVNEGVKRVEEWLEAFDKAAAELPLE